MLKVFNQFLMLGGFYFILSFILNTRDSDIFYYASLFFFAVLVVLVFVLFIKKNFAFLEKFETNNPKISNYLKAVGVAQYFDIFFGMIPSMFIETQPHIPAYFRYAAIVYLAILLFSLIYTTYYNFTKYKNKKDKVKKTIKKTAKKTAKKARKKTSEK